MWQIHMGQARGLGDEDSGFSGLFVDLGDG